MPPRSDHQTTSVTEARGRKSVPTAIMVTETATLLAPLDALRINFLVYNAEAEEPALYIGSDATVTSANGVPVAANATFEDITSYDEWWGIVEDGHVDARIIITTVDA